MFIVKSRISLNRKILVPLYKLYQLSWNKPLQGVLNRALSPKAYPSLTLLQNKSYIAAAVVVTEVQIFVNGNPLPWKESYDYNHSVKFSETVPKSAVRFANCVTEAGWDDRSNQLNTVKETLKSNTLSVEDTMSLVPSICKITWDCGWNVKEFVPCIVPLCLEG